MRAFITTLALSLLASVTADVVNVTVGADEKLIYQPWNVTAKDGDVIVFHFVSKNHTVTQSTFANPCNASESGVGSGFRPASNTSHPTFNFTVTNSSEPNWFFCAQANHCVNGMVFAVNPTVEKTFDAFQAKAKSLNPNNTTPSSSSSFTPSFTPSSTPSGSSTGTSASPTATDNAAMRLGENTLGIMTAVAVIFGLVL